MMRIDLAFEKPLKAEEKTKVQLALGTLVKVKRVRIIRGDRLVTVYGEGLGTRSVREALAAEGFTQVAVGTTLEPAADADCDEPLEQQERVRAIGR